MKATDHITKIFYLLLITILVFLFSFVFIQTAFYEDIFLPNSPFIFQLMLYYIFFIFARVGLHLALSFIDYLFTNRLPDPSHYPLVTILMPCFNEEIGLESAVHSVISLDYPNIEVLIIDDGSTDHTLDLGIKISLSYPHVRVITQKNGGKASALNYGISEASGDYILCMDSDSILSRNCLMMAMEYFQHYPNLAAVAGGVHVATNKKIITWFQSLEYIIGLNFFKSAQSALSIVPIVPGPIGVFKKKAVIDVKGYLSDTFAEDADLSMRLLIAGYDIKYCSAIKATTEAPDSMQLLLTQRYRWNRGMTQTIMANIKTFHERKHKMRAFVILSYMFLETILIPLINFAFAITTIQYALIYNDLMFLSPYFFGLTILDIVLSLYSVVMEKRFGFLFILAIFNRATYGLALEVVRFFSLTDEIFNIPMKWGIIKRRGIS